jgi:hypothetical protein
MSALILRWESIKLNESSGNENYSRLLIIQTVAVCKRNKKKKRNEEKKEGNKNLVLINVQNDRNLICFSTVWDKSLVIIIRH